MTPIGVVQVLQMLVQQFEVARAEVESRGEFNVGGAQGNTLESATDAVFNEMTKYTLTSVRDTASFNTLVQSELARVREEITAYRQAAKDPPPGFKRLSNEEKEKIQTRFNRLKKLVDPSPLEYTGTLPALQTPLSLSVLPMRSNIAMYSSVGNTLGIHDQAFRSWLRSALKGSYRRMVYDVELTRVNGSPVTGPLQITSIQQRISPVSLKLHKLCLAVAVAAKRTNDALLSRRIVSNHPSNPITVVQDISLIGWHISISLAAAPPGFEDVVRYVRNKDVNNTNDAIVRRRALCDAVLDNKPSRQLGAIVLKEQLSTDAQEQEDEQGEEGEEEMEEEEGEDGVADKPENTPGDAAPVPRMCIEFGEGAQNCKRMNFLMEPIEALKEATGPNAASFPVFTQSIPLYRGREDRTSLEEFRNSDDVSAIVNWGKHARVLFKITGGGVAIVDPWKPAKRVRIPTVVREVFGVSVVPWVERSSEQCSEASCTYVSLSRALVIAAAASAGLSTMIAARSDIRTGSGPYAVAMVKMLIYARDAARLQPSPERLS